MLTRKSPTILATQISSLPISSLRIQLATTGIRASDLQTSTMPPDTRSQDLKKLEESFEVANKEQMVRHEKVLAMLETYGQQVQATKLTQDTKIEQRVATR